MSTYVIPPTLGRPVTSRTFSWLNEVERAWGSSFRQPDRGVYVFSDGRSFESTDMFNTGIYNGGIKTNQIFDSSGQPVTDSSGNYVFGLPVV